MNIHRFNKEIIRFEQDLDNLIRKKMPVLAGGIAKNHIKENFRKGGFRNNGLQKWPVTKRQLKGSPYGPLLSKRDHLMNNIRYVPGDGEVTIINDTPYAGLHNYGGEINTHPTVTPKMRKFAWAKYHEITKGKNKNVPDEAQMWKRLALTKKAKLNIKAKIPQRQFMGDSKELQEEIRKKLESEIEKLL